MGVVFKASHLPTNRSVAVKVLRQQYAQNATFARRFLREARSAGRLRHPNIVKIYDAGRSPEGHLFYAMEYVDGETLEARIAKEGYLDERSATEIMLAISSGIGVAEGAGVVHRDIKPGNILIASDGVPKLADFGVAMTGGDSTITEDGEIVGTPAYLCPDQVRVGVTVDVRSDIYSLGATFYHAIVGETPFEAPTLATMLAAHLNGEVPSAHHENPSVSQHTSCVIQKMMAKKKGHRYQSAAELTEELELLLQGRRPRAAGSALSPSRMFASLTRH